MEIKSTYKILLFLFIGFCFSCEKLERLGGLNDEKLSSENYVNVLLFRDSTESDHEMIQMAIDYADDNGISTVYVPNGEYQIDAAGVYGSMGLLLYNNIHFMMADSATLRAIQNDTTTYYVVRIHDVQNVKISGGNIIGERDSHIGTTGEWGMGIDLRNTNNIRIENVKISDCWGDGIYIGRGVNENIRISGVVCNNNRRQGMSITKADSVSVSNSVFKNTNGASPQAGIDLEPNYYSSVTRIVIQDCVFENNASTGVLMAGNHGPVSQVSIIDSEFLGNRAGIAMAEDISDVQISSTTITGTRTEGIRMRKIENVTLSDVTISEFAVRGVYVYDSCENIDFLRTTVNTDTLNAIGLSLVSSEMISLVNSEIVGGKYGISGLNVKQLVVDSTRFVGQDANGFRLTGVNNSLFQSLLMESISGTSAVFIDCFDNEILDSQFSENSFSTNNLYSYILFDGTSNDNECLNNIISGGGSTKKARYGIRLRTGTFSNLVSGNIINTSAYITAPIIDESGSNTIL